MPNDRPTPEDLLERLKAEENQAHRGKLKIFFGYAAGVGKTYAMLEAAHRERKEGVDVVVGYVEPHARPETEALVHGFETLPPKLVPYRNVNLREFDLDAALARKPQLILVDELAHSNAEGLRHSKRWQDVEELLEAGINVYSTLNVQHVESLNDIIGQITGVVVRETLPDSVLEKATDIELVDLTPEELLERLKEGKVYIPHQAERALEHFFQRSNLVALRELSLRQVAQRLSKDVAAARREKAAQVPWATGERLLVCIGPSPTSAKLIRSAKRMASAFGADWLAVAVETPGTDPGSHHRVAEHLHLAESLGAETHILMGEDVAHTLVEFARSQNVTKIVVGKTAVPLWKRLFRRTVIDRLLESSGDIDVYVIRGDDEGAARSRTVEPARQTPRSHYLHTALVVAACALLGHVSQALSLSEANIVMVFLLGVTYVSYRFGRGPAIAAAVANVLVFDFFFVQPYLRFTVQDSQYVFTFAVMLVIGLLISALTVRMKDQLRTAQELEQRSSALFQLTKQLTEIAGLEFLIQTAGRQLRTIFDGEVVIFVRESRGGPMQLRFGQETSVARQDINAVVADWVAGHDKTAGAGTDTLPNATALFAPLVGSQSTIGAIGIKPNDLAKLNDPELRRLLETCASLIALSFDRDQSVLEASEAELRVQAEQMRSSLLSSVSHDLRTPLAAITGAASSLLETSHGQDESVGRELLQTIADESRRMTRLVENLLEMTRLESGAMTLHKQWHVVEEIVGSALARVRSELRNHKVSVKLPPDLPLLQVDSVMFEQVLINLFENAGHYTPPGSEIEVSGSRQGNWVIIRVADNGPGLPEGTEAKIFEKFYRATPAAKTGLADNRRGVGLGLAICKAIVQAHGGKITARTRPGGGAEFTIQLACEHAPHVPIDEIAAGTGS